MKKQLSDRQMINNELAARAGNKESVKVLKRHTPPEEHREAKIEFTCECADADCRARVRLTLHEYEHLHKDYYEHLHKDYSQFIVAKGHVESSIEQVQKSTKNLTVVEKYAL